MKKVVGALLISLLSLLSFGCTNESQFKATPVIFAKRATEESSLKLADVLAGTGAALAKAGEKIDALDGDQFLDYVIQTKERDYEAFQKTKIANLTASVSEAQTQLTNETPVPQVQSPTVSQTANPDQTAATEPEKAEATRYYNADLGFSIVFPVDWQVKEANVGDTQMVGAYSPQNGADDAFSENLAVSSEELPLAMTAEQYLELSLISIDDVLTDFKEVSRSALTIDGVEAKQVVYTYRQDTYNLKAVMTVLTKDSKGYAVTGTAVESEYEKYLTDFDAGTKSFKF